MTCLFPHHNSHGVCVGHEEYVRTAHVLRHVTPLLTPLHAGRYNEESPASLVLTTHDFFPVERNLGEWPVVHDQTRSSTHHSGGH